MLEDEGVIIPSSSSKDDDILSESSDDIETIAMQTLEHIREDVGGLGTCRESISDLAIKVNSRSTRKLQRET